MVDDEWDDYIPFEGSDEARAAAERLRQSPQYKERMRKLIEQSRARREERIKEGLLPGSSNR